MVTSIERQGTQVELKPGWRVVRFGDVVRNVDINERDPLAKGLERYIGLDHIDPESLHIRRWGLIEEGTTFTRVFRPGQTLFGKRRAYQRKVALAEFAGICSGDILVFEATGDLLPELLPFLVQSDPFYEHAVNTSAGSLSPRTKWKDLAAYEFALPPKDEQRRIADILWAADEVVEAYRNAKAIQETCLVNVVDNFFTQKSGNSTSVKLSEVAEISYGLTINAERRKFPLERPYLRVANVMRATLDLNEIKNVKCTDDDLVKFRLQEGDVLVVEGHANVEEIGRASIWNGEIAECLHQNHLLRIRSKGSMNPQYIMTYLNSPYGRSYFRKHAKSSSGLNTINSTVLRELCIPLLPPEIQSNIAAMIQKFETTMQHTKNHIEQLGQLKKALLNSLIL